MAKDQETEEGMISRWSKRKRGLEVDLEKNVVSEEEQALIDEELEAELLANREAAEEIDLDTINEESDLSVFMKRGVPDELKKQALSILWRSNPIFANIDGLNDYDQDFGDKGLNMKVFKSAWQAGRGYLKEIEEKLEVVSKEDEAKEVDTQEAVTDEADEQDIHNEVAAEEIDVLDEKPEVAEASSYKVLDEPQKERALPKVSLRQRLALDG